MQVYDFWGHRYWMLWTSLFGRTLGTGTCFGIASSWPRLLKNKARCCSLLALMKLWSSGRRNQARFDIMPQKYVPQCRVSIICVCICSTGEGLEPVCFIYSSKLSIMWPWCPSYRWNAVPGNRYLVITRYIFICMSYVILYFENVSRQSIVIIFVNFLWWWSQFFFSSLW